MLFSQMISMRFHPINLTRSFDSFSSVLKIKPGTCSRQPSSLPLSNTPSPRPWSMTWWIWELQRLWLLCSLPLVSSKCAPKKQRQKCPKFTASLIYVVKPKSARATDESLEKKKKGKECRHAENGRRRKREQRSRGLTFRIMIQRNDKAWTPSLPPPPSSQKIYCICNKYNEI